MSNFNYRRDRDRDYHRQSDYDRYNGGSRREKRVNDTADEDAAYPDKRMRREYEQSDFRRDTRRRGNDYDERNYNRGDSYRDGRDRDFSRYSPSASSHDDPRERDRYNRDSNADFSRGGRNYDNRGRYERNGRDNGRDLRRDDGRISDAYDRDYSGRYVSNTRRDGQDHYNEQRNSYGGGDKYNQRSERSREDRDQRTWNRDQGQRRGSYDLRDDDGVSPRGVSHGNARTRSNYRQNDSVGGFDQDRASGRDDFNRRGSYGQNRNHGGYHDERRVRDDRGGRDSRRGFGRENDRRGNGGRNQDHRQRDGVIDVPRGKNDDILSTEDVDDDEYYDMYMKHITRDLTESWWDGDDAKNRNEVMETSPGDD